MDNLMKMTFHGAELYGVNDNEAVFVALKPMVDAMGLDWEAQRQRIQRDEVLSEGTCMIQVPSSKGLQPTLALRIDLINGWLFKIDCSRVRDASVRQRIKLYQRDCYKALWHHFSGNPQAPRVLRIDRTIVDFLHETRMIWGRRAAAKIWHMLGLPRIQEMANAFAQGDLFEKGE